MILSRNKKTGLRTVYLVAVYFLFGSLTLLCVQARISKVIPQEGPLQYLSSIAKMINDRSPRSEQLEWLAVDEVEPSLHREELPDAVLIALPALPTLTILQRNPLRSAYYLRPPPQQS
jgi:hypothetical protein